MILKIKKQDFFDSLGGINIDKNKFSIFEKTEDFQRALFKLIQTAKQRIYITALYLQDDNAGKDILTALFEAKKNNPQLDIKIFVDFLRAQRGLMGHDSSIGNVRLYRELSKKYDCEIDIFGVPVKSKEFLGVLHLKGFVFDNKLLYSGASLNNIYLHYGERYRYDRYHLFENQLLADSFVRFLKDKFTKNDAVRSLSSDVIAKVKTLKGAIRKLKISLRKSEYQFQANSEENLKNEFRVTPLLGFGARKNLLNKSILQLIKKTNKEIVIFTPYFNFPAKVHSAVRRLLKQNKKVVIIVGDKTANDFYIPEKETFNKVGILPYIYESSLRRYVKANQKHIDNGVLEVYLWLDKGNSFHLKGINSDKENYLITGHNINPRAWRLDIENGILIRDKDKVLQRKFESELKQIMLHCNKVNHYEEIEQPSDYPDEARKLLKNVKRAKLDSILNRLL